jgi:hypothetical protein
MRGPSSHGKRPRADRHRREAGIALVTQLITTAVATVGLLGAVGTACVGVLTTRRAASAADARMAAQLLLDARVDVAREAGGSIAPDPPVTGFVDLVTLDAARGRVLSIDEGELGGGPVFRRQWRVRLDEITDVWLLEVSSELLLDEKSAPRSGADATRVRLSRGLW